MIIEDEEGELDLADALNEALDAGKPQQAPVEGETQEQQEAREYVREGRRFVPKPKDETPVQAVPAEGAKPAEAAAAPAKPAWKPTWYKDEFGPWDAISEPLRNALRDQERNAAQAIEKHSTSAKAWEPLTQALTPHMAELQSAGLSPQQYYSELHGWNVALRTGDQITKIDTLDRLAESVGLDLVQVGQWLAQNGKAPQPDPVIAALQRQLAELEGKITQSRTSGEEAAKAQTQKEIADWASDKPDFAAVRPLMAALAKQNPEASLDQLYEQARYAHPETRTRILKEIEDKRLAELRGKKAAGAQSPRGGFNGEAQRTYKNKTLEEEIEANL